MVLDYYYNAPWKTKIQSPAIDNIDYDDFRKIIYLLERMYKSDVVFQSIENGYRYVKTHKN
jgi:hypothetical protein